MHLNIRCWNLRKLLVSNEGKYATMCRDDAGNIARDLERFKKETDERVRCGAAGVGVNGCVSKRCLC
jgi:hypothetical protein